MPKSRQDSEEEQERKPRTAITVRPSSRRDALRQVESRLAANEGDSRPAKKRTTPPAVVTPAATEPAPVVRQRRGCMGTVALFGGLSLLVLTLALAIMMLAFTQQMTSFFDDPVDNVLEMFGIDRGNTEPEVVDTQLILLGIKDMAMLETTRGDILIEETVVQPKEFLLKDARLRVQYLGRVTAGIDLSQITEASILEPPDDRLVIQLRNFDRADWRNIAAALFGERDDYEEKFDAYMRRTWRIHGSALVELAKLNDDIRSPGE